MTKNKFMTKQQAEKEFKEIYKEQLKTGDKPLKHMLWNDYTDQLMKDNKISENKAYTWSTPDFIKGRTKKDITDNNAINNALKLADTGYREKDIIDQYESYKITNNGLTSEIYGKDGNGFQVVIKAFNGHKIGDITN